MRLRRRHLTLLIALGLVAGVLAGTAAAAPRAEGGVISGTITDPNAGNPCGAPFADTDFFVDAYNVAGTQRYGPALADGTGAYELAGLPAGTYKVRFRGFTDTVVYTHYVWYEVTKADPRATTFVQGDAVAVTPGQTTTVDICPSSFTGGTFKGSIQPIPAGVSHECMTVMPYEAASGIGVGLLDGAQTAEGKYRYGGQLPAGQYRALAWQSDAGGICTVPASLLDQWWRGYSGPGYYSMVDPDDWDSGETFAITSGGVTKGIHFELTPIGTCDGKAPTIIGTTGDDVITGTAGDDVIILYSGDDEAHGGDGDDTICGGNGTDNITGDGGRDRIFGEKHDDYIQGGGGGDYLHGGGGLDQLFGGPKVDKIFGGAGPDLINGDDGSDKLLGGGGNDTMYGGSGDDTLHGSRGTDDYGDGGIGEDTCTPSTEIQISC